MGDKGVSRRDLLKKAGLGGAVLIGGTVVGRSLSDPAAATTEDSATTQPHAETPEYGDASAPVGLRSSSLNAHTYPPRRDGRPPGVVRDVEIAVEERLIEIGAGVLFEAWTYNGTVPGPIIRATVGDLVRIHFENRTGRSHNIHFHGAHRPEHDGWEPIPPGGEFTYEIEAGPVGFHPYHCHTQPLAEHISKGLYGTMIVDPPGGRPPAREVALLLSGFSNEEIGRNGIVAWNGVAGFFKDYPIKVDAGEPVRAYITNMVEYESLASFHLHAETFDVYPAGMGDSPAFSEDTLALGMGQRAIVEFTLPTVGRYMFHPHQHWLAGRGAMGWFAAV